MPAATARWPRRPGISSGNIAAVTRTRRWAAAGCAAVAIAAGLGCGKKGPPLAPFVLLPGAPSNVAARRAGNDVYVTMTLPVQNVDASKPADVRRVDVYAFTATTPPSSARALELATQIATVPVAAAPAEGALSGQQPRTPVVKEAALPEIGRASCRERV